MFLPNYCIIAIIRHIPFLKAVFLHSITAFGGPQAHYGMMQKTFVQDRRDITDNELLDFNAFCNILPGASSTQILTLIGYKRGGVLLATITLIIWILPACFLMSLLSFLIDYIGKSDTKSTLFLFVQPMAIGFLIYAAYNAFEVIKKNNVVYYIIAISSIFIFIFFRFPWIFPCVLLFAGIITNLSRKRIPQREIISQRIKWSNLWLFGLIFIISGVLSEIARKNNWNNTIRKPINLFENTYRMGSLVFGGGQVLIPMMESQFSERLERKVVEERNPNAIKIEQNEFYTGAGIVRAIPGPVFSIAAFTGSLALKQEGKLFQVLGGVIGALAIFLPSALLVLFFYPIWFNLKKFATVYRAMEGINAAVVGIMIGSSFFMIKDISISPTNSISFLNLVTIIGTFILLQFTKLQAPVVVLFCLLLGLVKTYLFL